jgi:hypothetical protein
MIFAMSEVPQAKLTEFESRTAIALERLCASSSNRPREEALDLVEGRPRAGSEAIVHRESSPVRCWRPKPKPSQL